jgi:hypothetical protein
MEVARKAVETNFVMLWEYNPTDGLHFTKPVDDPLPVTEYLKAMGRFRHLSPDQISHIQGKVVENLAFVKQMAHQRSRLGGRNMSKQNSPATGLDPIEKASRDELQALQLQRMKWSLKHAYDNVPHYRKKYDAAGVHPDDLKQLSDLAKISLHHQARSARHLSLRHVRDADAGHSEDSRLVRHHGQTDGGGLYEKRHRRCGRASWRAPCVPRAARPTTSSSIPMATACLPAASAPTTAARPWAPR